MGQRARRNVKPATETNNNMQTISKEPTTRTVTIAPQDARIIWEDFQRRVADKTCPQRRLNTKQAEMYAKDMRSGAWAFTHQGIAFDVDGNLIDGQQRIFAIISAGVPVKMQVTTGLPVRSGRLATIDAIDGGRPRSQGDKLWIHGTKNSGKVAATINVIACGVCGPSVSKLSFPQVADINCIYGNHAQEIITILSVRPAVCVGYVMGPLTFAMESERDLAIDLAAKLSTLVGITERHPAKALIKSIESGGIAQTFGARQKASEGFHVVASALHAMKFGRQMQKVSRSAAASEWFLQSQPANVRKIMTIVRGAK